MYRLYDMALIDASKALDPGSIPGRRIFFSQIERKKSSFESKSDWREVRTLASEETST